MKIKDLFETDEMVWGGAIGLGFCFIIGWWSILLGMLTAVLTRLGGIGWLGTKSWRRIGVPVLIVIALWNLPLLARIISGLVTFGLLTIGYGTRTLNQDGTLQDEGSQFGNLCQSITGSEIGAHLMTRSLIVGSIWIVWYIPLCFV